MRRHQALGGSAFTTIRNFLFVGVLVFAFSRFATMAPLLTRGTGRTVTEVSSVSAVEKAKAIRLQADPIYKLDEENNQPETHTDTKLSSLSGSYEKPGQKRGDIEDTDSMEKLEYALPGEHPKVALMFLVKDLMYTEPVWRSFFEGAAKLRLKAPAVKPEPIDLETVVGGKLHPAMPSLDETRYPGYKIQHGLVPPSKYRKTKYPHVRKRHLLENAADDVIQDDQDNLKDSDSEERSDVVHGDNDGCPLERSILAPEAERILDSKTDGPTLYKSQDLFSLYIHTEPGFTFPSESIFSGRQVTDPVNCTNAFALHILVLAEFKLFEMALKDERNQKFVLLSPACVPAQPPEVVYAQAIYEQKSRIHACVSRDPGRLELWRWKEKMKTSHLKQQHWRKSQQWFVLNRAHAELVVADHHVKEVFKRYCWSYGKHICVSDEHYIPTLLASYDLDDQTDCMGEGTWTDWSQLGWHPRTFHADDVSTDLFQRILNGAWPPCDQVLARRTALELFDFNSTSTGTKQLSQDCNEVVNGTKTERQFAQGQSSGMPSNDWVSRAGYIPLGYECPLFARKFDEDAVAATVNATLSCSGGALGYWCREALMASIPDIEQNEGS